MGTNQTSWLLQCEAYNETLQILVLQKHRQVKISWPDCEYQTPRLVYCDFHWLFLECEIEKKMKACWDIFQKVV